MSAAYLCRYCGSDDSVCGEVLCRPKDTQPDEERMSETVKTVGSDFPAQMVRAQELLEEYRKIGPAGQFGALMIGQTIAEAQAAWESGDTVRILVAYENLRGLE